MTSIGVKMVQGDDGCNIHGMFHDVRDTGDGSTFELGSRPAGGISQMNIGGRYEFRNRNNWVRLHSQMRLSFVQLRSDCVLGSCADYLRHGVGC